MLKTIAVRPSSALLTNSEPLSLADGAQRLVSLLETRTVRLENGLTKFLPGRGPTGAERGVASNAIVTLGHQLSVAVSDRCIEEAVLQLYGAMKWRREDQDLQVITDAFLIALDGRPHETVVEAVRRILRGEAALSKTFVPTCAELSQVAAGIEAQWQGTLWKLRKLLTMDEARERSEEPMLTPEQKARVEAALDRMRLKKV